MITDRELLQTFVNSADPAAFAELVRRHGPLVLGVCRRVLNDTPDADDAFQAVFLVLARKARSVRRPDLLGNWLYGVALRCARRVHSRQAERQAREQPVTDAAIPDPLRDAAEWRDVRPVLDEEIARLPEKLRVPLVLCELEGVPRPEAAHRLGVPEGTLSSRLARGKDALRQRLLKRGITLSAVSLGVLLSQTAPAVQPGLVEATTTAAIGFAAGTKATSVAAGIATKEVQAMFWAKAIKVGVLTAIVAVTCGGVAVAYREGALNVQPDTRSLRQLHDSLYWSLHGGAPKKADKDKVQGEWKVTLVKVDGKDADGNLGLKALMFTGEKVVLGQDHEGTFKLDAEKSPKQIDLKLTTGPHPGDFPGVYKLEDDKLTIHVAHPGGERPGDFECKEGAKTVLIVLERVKK